MSDDTSPHSQRKVPVEKIVQWLRVLVARDSAVEMRIIGNDGRADIRFYTPEDFPEMARDAVKQSKTAKGVYFTLNCLPPDQSTPARDVDVRRRRWLLIDLDPKRDGDVSSTASEKNLAQRMMRAVRSHLSEQGWPAPIIADSGNGWHLLYRIDLPNDDTSKSLVNGVLKALANRFSDDTVDIDTKVGNAARICKLYGTKARKGVASADRPHRFSRIKKIPPTLTPVSRRQLKAIADSLEKHPTPQINRGSPTAFNQALHRVQLDDARRYLRKCDPAISGFNGHKTTLNTAQKLLGNFPHLTDDDAFLLLSEEWNPTCDPPWSEGDLRRKVAEARKTEPHPTLPENTGTRQESNRSSSKPGKQKQKSMVSGTTPRRPPPDAYQPFPVEALPDPLKRYVEEVAQSIGCDPAFVAVPMLSVLAATVGNSRRIELKEGWTEPAIIWSALVGESGTQKTPAFKQVVNPIHELQTQKLLKYEEELAEYKKDYVIYERDMAKWKGKGSNAGDPPEEPERPTAVRYIVSDTTMEALAPILAANQRGVLLASDELAAWAGSFDRYSKSNADRAHWLSIFSGYGIIVDRKTGDRPTVSIPHPAVSVTGGIQPGILQRTFGQDHRESGLLARVLLAWPPRRTKQWNKNKITADLKESYAGVIRELLELQPELDADNQPTPVILPISDAAEAEWEKFYNQHAHETAELAGDEAAAFSKLEAYAARFALIIHCVRIVTNDPTLKAKKAIDRQSIRAGINLSRWFAHEALRIYEMLRDSDDDRELRQFAEKLALRGKKLSARDLSENDRKFPTSDDAERMLMRLVKAGFGSWENVPTTPKGGPPTRKYRPNQLTVPKTP